MTLDQRLDQHMIYDLRMDFDHNDNMASNSYARPVHIFAHIASKADDPFLRPVLNVL